LKKKIRLEQESSRKRPTNRFLSDEVTNLQTEISGFENAGTQQFLERLQKRLHTPYTLSFESARFRLMQLPLDITAAILDYQLKNGLPNVDYFQFNMLGGTILGSGSINQKAGGYFVHNQLKFSGINVNQLIPGAPTAEIASEAELSGQVSIRFPLSTQLTRVLEQFEASIVFNRIGARALERILFVLDPYESNEVIVSQRNLLRSGSPRWFQLAIKNGNLSLEGEAKVKGTTIALPRLTRFNITNLSGLNRFERYLVKLDPFIKALRVLSAERLTVEKSGKIRFVN
jgi:hypothetical protein